MSDLTAGGGHHANGRGRAPLLGGEWARTLGAQGRVLAAIFFREAGMRRGRASSLSWLVAGLEPLLMIGAISTLFLLVDRKPAYGESMLLFVGTGVFPVYLFIHTSLRVREPLTQATHGKYPIERPLDEVAAHALLHLMISAAMAIAYFAALYASGVKDALPYDLLSAVEALAAIFSLGVGLGVFNSVFGRLVPFWNTIWPAVARAILHFSGLYFMADYLSPDVRRWFALNPVLHGVNWFRHAFYPFYPGVIDNHAYLLLTSLIALALGLALERVVRRGLVRGEPLS